MFVHFAIVLWRGFIDVKITEWNVNKSASRLFTFTSQSWSTPYKKVREFPIPLPSRDVTTKLSLGGNNDFISITELFLPRGSLVSDIPAGDGKLVNLFYGVVPPSVLC